MTDRVRFCSRCGVIREEKEIGFAPPDVERVCSECGMGVLLVCGRDALPNEHMAFLIVTDDLRISAVSQAGERIFGTEAELVGTMLFATISCPLGLEELALRVSRAASGDRDVILLPIALERRIRPGFRGLEARVASCGPPRGALVALEPLLA